MAKYPCRLRKMRKSAHLSQHELARLLGLRSQSLLSEIETGLKRPSVVIALASAVVFDTTIAELFPGLANHAERTALAAALELHKGSLDEDTDATAFVAALISRLNKTSDEP